MAQQHPFRMPRENRERQEVEQLHDKVRVQLERIHLRKQEFETKAEHYLELIEQIKLLQENKPAGAANSTDPVPPAESLVELGAEMFVRASIPDTSRIFVDVGLGFFAEFTLEEAQVAASLLAQRYREQVERVAAIEVDLSSQLQVITHHLVVEREGPQTVQ